MAQPTLKRVDPSTIQDKLLVGYQGWFTCAGDGPPIGPGHHGWLHWFDTPIPGGGRPNVDLWPDTSEYDPSELYPAPGLTMPSGDPVYLFSSRNPKTVRRHFHWMALHGVDGAFLQRFAGQCEVKSGNHGIRDLRDEVGDRVREAAEAEGRVFAIMYDVSGVSPDKIQMILEQDWAHLLSDQRIIDSPNYLREKGRPVVALWGFGLSGRNHTPDLVRTITESFRRNTPGGVYLVAGIAGHWRTSNSDADKNPLFVQVWTECFDSISPWTVGRYGDEAAADKWGEERVKADADFLRVLAENGGRKIDYMPVVLPGGSGFNLSQGKWGMNDIRRNGGRFLWRQIYNARRAGVRTIYCAMWDEYDEGTVFMPVVSHSSQLPVHPGFRFIALDVDGHDLPPDWYMRIAGYAAEALHGERSTLPDTLPYKELQDYWSTRPRYEGDVREAMRYTKADEGVDGATRAFGELQVSGGSPRQSGAPPDAPPPYTLEDMPAQSRPHSVGAGQARPPPPPVRHGTRPSIASLSSSNAVPISLVAGVTAGAAAMHRHRPSIPPPPPVDMSSRPPLGGAPAPPTRPRPYPPPSSESTMAMPAPPGPPPVPSSAYAYNQPPYSGHGPRSPYGHPGAVGVMPMPGSSVHPHVHARGRSRSRSESRGKFGSKSRSRSRSKTRKHENKHKHGRRSSSSGSESRRQHGDRHAIGHEHGHGHTHSVSPVGSSHVYAGGMHHAYSEGGYGQGHERDHGHGHGQGHGGYGNPYGHAEPVRHGSYAPVHSAPVGHGQTSAYAPYAGAQQPQGYPNQPPQGGYDAGFGYGQGGSQAYPYGYTPHPSSSGASSSSYYAPYGGSNNAGTATAIPAATGAGTGVLSGGIATALQKVEGIAGKQTRDRLESTVKSLSNSFSKFR